MTLPPMTHKAIMLLAASLLLSACASRPDIMSKDGLAKAANTTIDGTATALEVGTGRISDLPSQPVRSVTKVKPVADAANPVGEKNFKDAVLSPLSDLNIRRREFPERLAYIQSPYDAIPDKSCAGLENLIAELDVVLGPDIDISDAELEETSKLKDRSRDVSIAGVASAAGGFIPGRGVIREATGAGPRDRAIRAEYQKGVARRSYLKGIGAAKGCFTP